jgi:hypothetical protein
MKDELERSDDWEHMPPAWLIEKPQRHLHCEHEPPIAATRDEWENYLDIDNRYNLNPAYLAWLATPITPEERALRASTPGEPPPPWITPGLDEHVKDDLLADYLNHGVWPWPKSAQNEPWAHEAAERLAREGRVESPAMYQARRIETQQEQQREI